LFFISTNPTSLVKFSNAQIYLLFTGNKSKISNNEIILEHIQVWYNVHVGLQFIFWTKPV